MVQLPTIRAALIVGALFASGCASTECVELETGRWTMSGNAFGMPMDATVDVNGEACEFSFSDWNMVMFAPTGGTLHEEEVHLGTADYWQSCAGTVTDATEVVGVCESDGGSWGMTFDG